MSGENHCLLPGVVVDQFLTASPKNTLRIMASRSTAIDTARRNTGFLNQAYFTGSTYGSPIFLFGTCLLTLLRLKKKKFVLRPGPRSYTVKFFAAWFWSYQR